MVQPGDVIRLHMEDVQDMLPNPDLRVPLVFSDGDVLFFDKPAGMPVHPSHGHRNDTLGNAFAAQYPSLTFRPVNRLDRNTSGLVAAAAHAPAATWLPERLEKTYLALVSGNPPDSGTVRAPIARVPDSLIARCVAPEGKPAVTHFKVLCRGHYTLLRLCLETGRTHQIRVHLSSIGCPLAGDDLYGGSREDIARHALHCAEILYTDSTDLQHRIVSPLPEDMLALTEYRNWQTLP
jgi:23S rRNA pseudouridine1911/1915/1917 synthase